METLLQAFKTRRTNYVLGKDVTVPDDTIIAMIQDIVREVLRRLTCSQAVSSLH